MKQATKQQQDAKTSAAATEATKTSAKQAPGKRKASPEQAKPATGNGNSIYQKNFALRGKNNTFFIQSRHRTRSINQPPTHILYTKKIRPCGAETFILFSGRLPPHPLRHAPATHILYTKKFPPCGAKNFAPLLSARHRPRPQTPQNQTGTISNAPALEEQNAHTKCKNAVIQH